MTNHPVLSRQAVRDVDRCAIEQYRIPGMVLMENAGRGCADVMCRLGIAGPVLICCGKGNNAGDGLVIARHLDLRGYQVQLLFWADPHELAGDAGQNYAIALQAQLSMETLTHAPTGARLQQYLSDADWVVDALLGTGAHGEPRPPLPSVIEQMNGAAAKKMAIDVPSGLDCQTGQAAGSCFQADHTCTFVAAKPGLVTDEGRQYTGQLHILDIAPRKLLQQFGVA